MEYTEKIEIDRIEVSDFGIILVRQATTIEKDGEFISRTFHRWSLTPDQDISNQEQKVKDICNATWTDEVKESYKLNSITQAFKGIA